RTRAPPSPASPIRPSSTSARQSPIQLRELPPERCLSFHSGTISSTATPPMAPRTPPSHSNKENIMRIRLIILFAILCSANAFAQRTFVASTGLDTNPCSRTAPCRSFGAAITAVAPGGEVIVLDSAGYGPASVTKSVSLIAPGGVYAGVTVPSGVGLTVNVPSGVINLRGLNVNGTGGTDAIDFSGGGGAELHVENLV